MSWCVVISRSYPPLASYLHVSCCSTSSECLNHAVIFLCGPQAADKIAMVASRSKPNALSNSPSHLLSPFLLSDRDSTVSSLMASQENISFTSSIRQAEPELWRKLKEGAEEPHSPGHLSRLMEQASLRRTASATLEELPESPEEVFTSPRAASSHGTKKRRPRQESII
jgi:hypothetical protein